MRELLLLRNINSPESEMHSSSTTKSDCASFSVSTVLEVCNRENLREREREKGAESKDVTAEL